MKKCLIILVILGLLAACSAPADTQAQPAPQPTATTVPPTPATPPAPQTPSRTDGIGSKDPADDPYNRGNAPNSGGRNDNPGPGPREIAKPGEEPKESNPATYPEINPIIISGEELMAAGATDFVTLGGEASWIDANGITNTTLQENYISFHLYGYYVACDLRPWSEGEDLFLLVRPEVMAEDTKACIYRISADAEPQAPVQLSPLGETYSVPIQLLSALETACYYAKANYDPAFTTPLDPDIELPTTCLLPRFCIVNHS